MEHQNIQTLANMRPSPRDLVLLKDAMEEPYDNRVNLPYDTFERRENVFLVVQRRERYYTTAMEFNATWQRG
eukprot:scaffold49757_cov82-Cyclotella_meneghiniana.AAC.4